MSRSEEDEESVSRKGNVEMTGEMAARTARQCNDRTATINDNEGMVVTVK
jgi:hypothetical protein